MCALMAIPAESCFWICFWPKLFCILPLYFQRNLFPFCLCASMSDIIPGKRVSALAVNAWNSKILIPNLRFAVRDKLSASLCIGKRSYLISELV